MSRSRAAAAPRRARLDQLLVQRGEVPDLATARALILAGRVHGDDRRYTQAGQQIACDAQLTVRAARPFASRGGEKLSAALDAWPIAFADAVCLDVGASTGGFTDVLLQCGAEHVYAVDVGYGQLAETLRRDARVTSLERTHICELDSLPERPNLAVIDVSFIGLCQVLPCVQRLLGPGRDVVALVKPQFEAPPEDVDERGVVRDRLAQGRAVGGVISWAVENQWRVGGVLRSPLVGPAGNREWFVWLRSP
ncbi:MAG: TlyA family RNA methyltransferase [Chloroflexi bacterium]|nr:TlyA family RNA methyltransferase [Chloroflexota bacterium]MYF22149.1 TlyA family RNA methyltransferase [Chloroflexota bacterium]